MSKYPHSAQMLERASLTLMQIQSGYANKGITLAQAALAGSHDFVAWNHYPAHDYVDSDSGYEFYYHAHDQHDMPESEHGHFHLFYRNPTRPNRFIHLISIALNTKGLPVRLFTTNEWVTGESMVDAKQVLGAINRFTIRAQGRLAPIAKWLKAILTIYSDEIAQLITKRDKWIAEKLAKGSNRSFLLNNRKHHVLSECSIDLIQKLTFISHNSM